MNAESYLVLFFIGFLGLFNSASLELRQITDSKAELVFQNGMIISTTLMVVSIAGSIGETIAYVRYKNKRESQRAFNKAIKKEEEE